MRTLIIIILVLLLLAGAGYLIYSFVTGTFSQNNVPTATPTFTSTNQVTVTPKPNITSTADAEANPARLSASSDFQSGVVGEGRTKVIKLYAVPTGSAQKMQLRIRGVNLQILSYTGPDSKKWTVTKSNDCNSFAANTYACYDLQKKSGDITYGESIGQLKVKFAGLGDAYLEFVSGNGYFVNNVLDPVLGKFSTFSVVNASDLPSTALISDQADQLILALSLVMFTLIAVKLGYITRFAYWLTAGIEPDFTGAQANQLNLWQTIKQKLALRRMKSNAHRNLEKLAKGE